MAQVVGAGYMLGTKTGTVAIVVKPTGVSMLALWRCGWVVAAAFRKRIGPSRNSPVPDGDLTLILIETRWLASPQSKSKTKLEPGCRCQLMVRSSRSEASLLTFYALLAMA